MSLNKHSDTRNPHRTCKSISPPWSPQSNDLQLSDVVRTQVSFWDGKWPIIESGNVPCDNKGLDVADKGINANLTRLPWTAAEP